MRDVWFEITTNRTLWIAILAWAVAQLIKILVEFVKTKKIRLSLWISSGGMPSSHTSFVTAVSTSIGMLEGFNSPLFALAAILSLVVMYDATGVRRAAGNQAAVINIIVDNIENKGVILDKKLKELLGHTPIEVAAGAILGIGIAIICLV